MPIVKLKKGYGTGHKEYFGVSAITGTGDIETGLRTITSAVATVQDAAATVTTQSASVTAVAGGKVSVVVVDQEVAANVISSAPKNVAVHAIGE